MQFWMDIFMDKEPLKVWNVSLVYHNFGKVRVFLILDVTNFLLKSKKTLAETIWNPM